MTQNWIWTNKEWLFSGIGVVLVLALVSVARRWLRKRPEPSSFSSAEEVFLPTIAEVQPPPHRLWTVLNEIPGFRVWAQRHIFTDAEIRRRIRIGVCGSDEGMSFSKVGEQGRVRVWLDVVNFDPFSLTIDRITGNVTVAGCAVAELKAC